METKFIKLTIDDKGDFNRGMNLCNPVHLTKGIWIATNPLCIEGIPVKLDYNTSKQIVAALGGCLPEEWMIKYIRESLCMSEDTDYFDNNDEEKTEKVFLKEIWLEEFSSYTGSFMEDGEVFRGDYESKNYVYPIFWRKP